MRTEKMDELIPIKGISNGVIRTRDERFIKILEVLPVNFLLRSDEAQADILSAFASWLKVAPARLQIKSISRRANVSGYVHVLQSELAAEKNGACARMVKEYIDLVNRLSGVAPERRCFLIFGYEGADRVYPPLEKVYSELYAAEQTARASLALCANRIVRPTDEDVAAAENLYAMIGGACDLSFFERAENILVQEMAGRGKGIGAGELPEISPVRMIAPSRIDVTHRDYVQVDGAYRCHLYIRGDGYPAHMRGGWLISLLQMEGVDVDVFLSREDRGKAAERVAQRIRLNKTKLKGKQDTSGDFESLVSTVHSGYYIKQGLAGGDDFFYLSVFLTLTADSVKGLEARKRQVVVMLRSMDVYVSECTFRQGEAFKSTLPLSMPSERLIKKARRNVLTGGAASAYPFIGYRMNDEGGVLIGVCRQDRSLCIVDLFNTERNKNANMNIIGTSGAGKTFTMQLLALRMRMRNIQCFILAPIKGHEFRSACGSVGGSYIRIAPGSKHSINIMEIRAAAEDFAGEGEERSLLSQKIQQMQIFFSMLLPNISAEEEQAIDEALIDTYAKYGITRENASLYRDAEGKRLKEMPVLGDLKEQLAGRRYGERAEMSLKKFVTGSAQAFNRRTNVDLDNKYIVLDLSELSGKLLPVGMMIALDFVWDKIKADRTQKKAVFIDEIWQLVGAVSNRMAAEFCLTIFKTIRGYGGAAIGATQDLSDFFGLEEGKYGRAIVNNSQSKIILNLEADEARQVQEVLKLTGADMQAIKSFGRGEAIVCTDNNKIPVEIIASERERRCITTDRAELAEMLCGQERG